MKPFVVLVKCLRKVPKTDRKRLRYHALRKTPICCGEDALKFADGNGGACPAVLASTRNVPHEEVYWIEKADQLFNVKGRLARIEGGEGDYLEALMGADERLVRQAMLEATEDLP